MFVGVCVCVRVCVVVSDALVPSACRLCDRITRAAAAARTDAAQVCICPVIFRVAELALRHGIRVRFIAIIIAVDDIMHAL